MQEIIIVHNYWQLSYFKSLQNLKSDISIVKLTFQDINRKDELLFTYIMWYKKTIIHDTAILLANNNTIYRFTWEMMSSMITFIYLFVNSRRGNYYKLHNKSEEACYYVIMCT